MVLTRFAHNGDPLNRKGGALAPPFLYRLSAGAL